MPTKKQLHQIWETELEYPETRHEDDPAYKRPNAAKPMLAEVKCRFRRYGNEEKICGKCGYVIPFTDNDKVALTETIQSTGEYPKCGI